MAVISREDGDFCIKALGWRVEKRKKKKAERLSLYSAESGGGFTRWEYFSFYSLIMMWIL